MKPLAVKSVATTLLSSLEQWQISSFPALSRPMIIRYGMSKDFDIVAMEVMHNLYLGWRHFTNLLRRNRRNH